MSMGVARNSGRYPWEDLFSKGAEKLYFKEEYTRQFLGIWDVWNPMNIFEIKKVIFNDPATIVFWGDGKKTVVKCSEGDAFDPEKGLAMAYIKKHMGNDNSYHKIFKKWISQVD